MVVTFEGQERYVPDVLIVGAAKSGTTSLAFFLKQHPQIFMPRKEPGFFAYFNEPNEAIPAGIRDRQITDFEEYSKMYENSGTERLICDASVAYLTRTPQTIANIKRVYGSKYKYLKIIMILRQPVERAFSHYLMFVKNGIEQLPFEEAIKESNVIARTSEQLGFDYLGNSLYFERVESFKREFPQCKIYITEDLKNPDNLLKDMLDFIGISQNVNINTRVRLNPSGLPKNRKLISILHKRTGFKQFLKRVLPDRWQFGLIAAKSSLIARSVERVKIDPQLKSQLIINRFSTDIHKTSSLIGRDLSSWI